MGTDPTQGRARGKKAGGGAKDDDDDEEKDDDDDEEKDDDDNEEEEEVEAGGEATGAAKKGGFTRLEHLPSIRILKDMIAKQKPVRCITAWRAWAFDWACTREDADGRACARPGTVHVCGRTRNLFELADTSDGPLGTPRYAFFFLARMQNQSEEATLREAYELRMDHSLHVLRTITAKKKDVVPPGNPKRPKRFSHLEDDGVTGMCQRLWATHKPGRGVNHGPRPARDLLQYIRSHVAQSTTCSDSSTR